MGIIRVLVFIAILLAVDCAYGNSDSDGAVTNRPLVCNDGRSWIGIASGFHEQRDYLLNNDRWEIQGWDYVAPGKCQQIGEDRRYFSGNLINRTYSLLLLAFIYKDTTGTWRAVHVPDTTDGAYKPTTEQLCVAWNNFRSSHARSQGGPESNCAKPGDFLVPAALEYAGFSNCGYYGGLVTGDCARDHLHVRLNSGDGGIALIAPPGSSGAAAHGTSSELAPIMQEAIRGAGAPSVRGAQPSSMVQVCVPAALVAKRPWADPQDRSAQAIKDTVRKFIDSHDFTPGVKPRFRVTEKEDRFVAQEVQACTDDDDDFNVRGP